MEDNIFRLKHENDVQREPLRHQERNQMANQAELWLEQPPELLAGRRYAAVANIAEGWVLMDHDLIIQDYNLQMDEEAVREHTLEEKEKEKQWESAHKQMEQIDQFASALKLTKLTQGQRLQRVEVFCKVWGLEGVDLIADEANREFAERINNLKKEYIPAKYSPERMVHFHGEEATAEDDMLQCFDRSAEVAKEERKKQLARTPGYRKTGGADPEEEAHSFAQDRRQLLHKADKWLLENALKQDPDLEQSIVFSILGRPERERMTIYYMLEHHYQTKMNPSYIPLAQLDYMPNLEQIEKNGLDFSKLKKVYQAVVPAQDTVKLWNQVSQKYEETLERRSLEEVLEQITELNGLVEEYKALGRLSRIFGKKRKLEEKMLDKVKNLIGVLSKHVDLTKINQQNDEKDKEKDKDKERIEAKLNKSEKQFKEKEKKITQDIKVGGEATSYWTAFGKVAAGSTVAGLKTAAEQLAKSVNLDTLMQAKKLGEMAGEGAKYTDALGIVNGVVSLALGVVMGTAGLVKERNVIDKLTIAERSLGIINSGLSGGNSIGSSIAKLAVSGAASTGVGIAGAAVGGITTGVGAYNFVHAGIEVRRAKQARERFRKLSSPEIKEKWTLEAKEKERDKQKAKEKALEEAREKELDKLWKKDPERAMAELERQKKLAKEEAEREATRERGRWRNRWDTLDERELADYREWDERENLIKLQSRIANRKKVTAGCQVVSGLCAAAAGGCSIGGQVVAAAALGIAGFAVTFTGKMITLWMKHKSSEKAIDEFLHIDEIMEEQVNKEVEKWGNGDLMHYSASVRKSVKDNLRTELMEEFGYTSEKAFFKFIMKTYADDIYGHIKNWIADMDRTHETPEERAYLDFVGSLGLAVRKGAIPTDDEETDDDQEMANNEKKAEKKNIKSGLPTAEMIYQKLMS